MLNYEVLRILCQRSQKYCYFTCSQMSTFFKKCSHVSMVSLITQTKSSYANSRQTQKGLSKVRGQWKLKIKFILTKKRKWNPWNMKFLLIKFLKSSYTSISFFQQNKPIFSFNFSWTLICTLVYVWYVRENHGVIGLIEE